MKFGPRRPSLRGRIAARTSLKRYVRQSLGLKAPRGCGWLTNPRRAAYNRVYNRTTFKGCGVMIVAAALGAGVTAYLVLRERPASKRILAGPTSVCYDRSPCAAPSHRSERHEVGLGLSTDSHLRRRG